ncbi:MAG: hypothetical protein VSS75_023700 [Candidatus Parabeggiatoa sp.]|nr:hypothetical protein [Candidatus Parabeggiatoa sp.]
MPNDQLNSSRRRFLAVSASSTLLGLIPELAYASVIRTMQGQVWVNTIPATLNTLIKPGDTVKTGANSQVIFVIGDDVYKLGARSSLRLRYNPGFSIVNAMHLISGSLLGVFGKRHGNKVIETQTATIGIRGTGLFLDTNPNNTYFCTCYGDTEMITHDSNRQLKPVNATYHKAYSISSHDAHNTPIASDIMKDHTDDELYYLESLVGRQPPAGFKSKSN